MIQVYDTLVFKLNHGSKFHLNSFDFLQQVAYYCHDFAFYARRKFDTLSA